MVVEEGRLRTVRRNVLQVFRQLFRCFRLKVQLRQAQNPVHAEPFGMPGQLDHIREGSAADLDHQYEPVLATGRTPSFGDLLSLLHGLQHSFASCAIYEHRGDPLRFEQLCVWFDNFAVYLLTFRKKRSNILKFSWKLINLITCFHDMP